MKLNFIRPESGDWLVIEDADTGERIYSGHGSGDEMWDVLGHLAIESTYTELPNEAFEAKY